MSLRPAPESPNVPVTHTRSPGRAPLRFRALPPSQLPSRVTFMNSLSGEAEVSPPSRATPKRPASSQKPAMNSSTHSGPKPPGRAMERNADSGRPPIAAMSLIFTAADFQPSSPGEIPGSRKWRPSTSRSVVTRVALPLCCGMTAQSSPMPVTPSGTLSRTLSLMRPISSNSPVFIICVFCVLEVCPLLPGRRGGWRFRCRRGPAGSAPRRIRARCG